MVDGYVIVALLWLVIGFLALVRPEIFARLGGRPNAHVNTRPIPGYLTYGLHVRLGGLALVVFGLIVLVVRTWFRA